jgi:hypothetical protein
LRVKDVAKLLTIRHVLSRDAATHFHFQSRQQDAVTGLSGDFNGGLELDYEAWRALLHSFCGRYRPEGVEPKSFAGSVRPATICGRAAVDRSCNAGRVLRTQQDVRLDSMELLCRLRVTEKHYTGASSVGAGEITPRIEAFTLAAIGTEPPDLRPT